MSRATDCCTQLATKTDFFLPLENRRRHARNCPVAKLNEDLSAKRMVNISSLCRLFNTKFESFSRTVEIAYLLPYISVFIPNLTLFAEVLSRKMHLCPKPQEFLPKKLQSSPAKMFSRSPH